MYSCQVATTGKAFGRVDADGTVWVKDGDWRSVGQVVGAEPSDALAFYETRFLDLEAQVSLLEKRSTNGAPAKDLIGAVEKLVVALTDAHAVGDLESLRHRVGAIATKLGDLKKAQDEASQAENEESLARRTAIVERAEAIAAQDPSKIHWRNSQNELAELFTNWQAEQKGPHRVSKKAADELWSRFRAARQSFDKAQRAHFHTKHTADKEAKSVKTELCEKAEALADQGAAGIPAYRALLEQWKKAPRAARALDNQMWDRFKAAGDALYNAGSAEWDANKTAKLALIDKYQYLLKETEVGAAKKGLRELHAEWDKIGHVAKADERAVNGKLAEIDRHVRGIEAEHLDRTNPEKVGRREGFAAQVEIAIKALEVELASAKDPASKKSIEAEIAAKRDWLSALG
ncbi:MAG: hypothetical protein RLZ72_749 [Actinomycetota bacterium]